MLFTSIEPKRFSSPLSLFSSRSKASSCLSLARWVKAPSNSFLTMVDRVTLLAAARRSNSSTIVGDTTALTLMNGFCLGIAQTLDVIADSLYNVSIRFPLPLTTEIYHAVFCILPSTGNILIKATKIYLLYPAFSSFVASGSATLRKSRFRLCAPSAGEIHPGGMNHPPDAS